MLGSNLKALLEDNLNVIVDLKGIQDIDSGIKSATGRSSAFHFSVDSGSWSLNQTLLCRKLFGAEKTHATSGEIMVGGTMSMPMTFGMSMTPAMAMDTRHLKVQVSSRATGKVVTTARCAITVINSATKKRMSVPVTLYGVKEGLADRHYGNNVSVPATMTSWLWSTESRPSFT